ncbi:MAG TPA: hypothetical protein VLC09_05405 [Polyangiaceae bacterium]|nr:hypothetical protein [Polyangiaceae bacterium]
MRVRAALVFGWATVLAACSAEAPPSPAKAPATPPAPLPIRPAEDSLPSAGIQLLVELRPREILENRALGAALEPLLPLERRRAFVATSGADPERIERAWFASYPLGRLWLFDSSAVGEQVEGRLRERAQSSSSQQTPANDRTFTFVMAGEAGAFYRNDAWSAVAFGDPTLARIARAHARGRISRTPSALRSLLLAPLATFDREAQLRSFFVGPFEGDPLLEALAAGELGLWASTDELRIRVHLLGAWDEGPAELGRAWEAWALAWLEQPAGRALGGGERTSQPGFQCERHGGPDPRTADLSLCAGEVRFSLPRAAEHWKWLSAERLGELGQWVGTTQEPPER